MAFDLLTNGGHVEGVRAREHKALATRRMVERQLLRDGTALRVTEHRGRVDVPRNPPQHHSRRALSSSLAPIGQTDQKHNAPVGSRGR